MNTMEIMQGIMAALILAGVAGVYNTNANVSALHSHVSEIVATVSAEQRRLTDHITYDIRDKASIDTRLISLEHN